MAISVLETYCERVFNMYMHVCVGIVKQESRAVAGKPRDSAVNFDRYGVCRQLFVLFDTFNGS